MKALTKGGPGAAVGEVEYAVDPETGEHMFRQGGREGRAKTAKEAWRALCQQLREQPIRRRPRRPRPDHRLGQGGPA